MGAGDAVIVWIAAAAVAGTVTDAAGREVTADADDRLVVLSGGITETVFALGAGDRVVAVDSTSVHPPAVEALPHLGYYRQLSAEPLLAFGADLIVLPDDAGPPGVIDQVRAAGVPVAVLPSAPSIAGAEQRLRMLGTLLDASERSENLISDIHRALKGVLSPSRARVLFVYARSAGTLQVAGQETAADEMIRLAGGQNAAQGWTGYRPLTAEAVIAARPDVLLVTDRGLAAIGGVDALVRAPGVALTPAGAGRRVVALDDLLLLGFGPRTGDAVTELARRLAAPQ